MCFANCFKRLRINPMPPSCASLQRCSWLLLPILNQCWSHRSGKSSLKTQAGLGRPLSVHSAIIVHYQSINAISAFITSFLISLLGSLRARLHFLACSRFFCMFVDLNLNWVEGKINIHFKGFCCCCLSFVFNIWCFHALGRAIPQNVRHLWEFLCLIQISGSWLSVPGNSRGKKIICFCKP